MGTSTEQVESFLRAVGRKHPVLILPHVNPDPDSLASALGLQAILAHHGVESAIGALGIIGRAENRAMVRVLDIDLVRQKNLDFKKFPKVVLLDSQPGRKNVGLPARRVPAAVIDHHPNWGTCDRVPYCDIREGYGATSTMVAEYLQTAGVEIDARLATALLYGIASETQDLGRDAYKPDHEAHMVLYPLADKQKLSRIRVPTLTKTYFRALHGAMESASIYDDVLVSVVKKLHYPDLVAELADYFLRIDGVKWAWVIGAYEGEYYLSCRTQDRTQNAAVVMAKVLRKIGQGGGHESIAGGKATPAENPDVDLPAEIEKRILRLLGKKVADRAPLIVEDAPKPAPKSDKSDKDKADA
ncbi:MAG: bifunctional oligoribonuclease/PAP phosphatase NrnA [Candidatus Methylomirabilis sp.]|nr:bifunctional oligoribonuclease/PAP phosphatase NrnA [Deltaproteobacteria bacterium]